MSDERIVSELRMLAEKCKTGAVPATKEQLMALHVAIGVFEAASHVRVPSWKTEARDTELGPKS